MAAMFGKQPAQSRRETTEVPADTVLGAGTVFEGQLTVAGSARIEGRITGTLKVTGLLVVGEKAEIVAEVDAGEARVAGCIRGNLHARELVDLLEGSRLEGDVYTKCFRIRDGAFFQGESHMGEIATEGSTT
jgi:cytoskeletal protein CcmA (bactofilin family)